MAAIRDCSKPCISTSRAHDIYSELGGGSVKSEPFAFIFTLLCEMLLKSASSPFTIKGFFFFRSLFERAKRFYLKFNGLAVAKGGRI